MTDEASEYLTDKHVYVVICADRDGDDRMSVHRSRSGADDAVDAFIAEYVISEDGTNEYTWIENRDPDTVDSVVRYVDTIDDGPWAQIEVKALEP